MIEYPFGLCPRLVSLAEVTGSVLLSQRSLNYTKSCRGLWVRPAPSAVAPLYLLLWESLPLACSSRDCWLGLQGLFPPERQVWLVVNNTDLGQTDFALILILGSICILRTNSPGSDCSHKPHLLYCREAAMRKCVIYPIHPTNGVHY